MDIFVKTLYWSKNVMSEAGNYPQSIINKQILDKLDAIIAIFGNKIGRSTQHYESGTIEEIELMIQKGKQVFVYFPDKPIRKSEIDMKAEAKIQAFKKKYRDRGIYVEYSSDEEFNSFLQPGIYLHGEKYHRFVLLCFFMILILTANKDC